MIGKVTDSPGMPKTEAIGAKVLARYCGDTQNKCASQRCLCNDPGAVVSLLNSWDIHNLLFFAVHEECHKNHLALESASGMM